jgi:hypothetical protein
MGGCADPQHHVGVALKVHEPARAARSGVAAAVHDDEAELRDPQTSVGIPSDNPGNLLVRDTRPLNQPGGFGWRRRRVTTDEQADEPDEDEQKPHRASAHEPPRRGTTLATKRFRERVAVITGGASGIGFATAERLAAEGMKLVLGDIEPGALDAAAATTLNEVFRRFPD